MGREALIPACDDDARLEPPGYDDATDVHVGSYWLARRRSRIRRLSRHRKRTTTVMKHTLGSATQRMVASSVSWKGRVAALIGSGGGGDTGSGGDGGGGDGAGSCTHMGCGAATSLMFAPVALPSVYTSAVRFATAATNGAAVSADVRIVARTWSSVPSRVSTRRRRRASGGHHRRPVASALPAARSGGSSLTVHHAAAAFSAWT